MLWGGKRQRTRGAVDIECGHVGVLLCYSKRRGMALNISRIGRAGKDYIRAKRFAATTECESHPYPSFVYNCSTKFVIR